MTLALREPAIHPEGNAIFGYDGGNHFARNGKVRPRGVFAASDNHPRDRTGRRIIELCLQVVLFEDFLYFCGREINTDNLKIFIYGI